MRTRTVLALAAASVALSGHMPARPAAADPTPAETARTVKAFAEAAARSLSPRSGDIFGLPGKYRYIIEGSYISRQTAHFPDGAAAKKIDQHGNHHGTLWDYDAHIPLILYGPGHVKAGWRSREAATQQDLVPTIAHVLGAVPPEDAAGRVLAGALKRAAKPPKVVLVLVYDQGGRSMLDAHPGATPFIQSMRRHGAWFEEARVTHLDPETIVGHVAIGTGAYPARHGVSANKPWSPTAGMPRMAVLGDEGATPSGILSPSLADAWLRQTGGKAVVIGQSLADRAAIGMVGHGGMYAGNPKPVVQWYDDKKGVWTTNPRAFRQPAYTAGMRPDAYWKALGGADGKWKGHAVDSPVEFKWSPASAKFDGDAMAAILEREPVGLDETPDLVFWSLKSCDYTSHKYGLESLEVREVLSTVDAQAKRIVELLERRVGRDRLLVAFTADHGGGLLPEFHGGARMSEEGLIGMINQRFDKRKNGVPLAQSVTSTQIYLDDAEMRANGVTSAQVRDFLKTFKPDGKPFYAAVYTREEIAAIAARAKAGRR